MAWDNTAMDVPDHYIVVRGGIRELPAPGTPFSASAGTDIYDAAIGIPHGQMRVATAAKIRELGGKIESKPERTKMGHINERHVEVTEGVIGAFGILETNPVPKEARIR
jgi:hypothetical protein